MAGGIGHRPAHPGVSGGRARARRPRLSASRMGMPPAERDRWVCLPGSPAGAVVGVLQFVPPPGMACGVGGE